VLGLAVFSVELGLSASSVFGKEAKLGLSASSVLGKAAVEVRVVSRRVEWKLSEEVCCVSKRIFFEYSSL
jgi:hypothetical protein